MKWFGAFPHPYKLLVAGNHDYCLDEAGRLSFGPLDIEAAEARARLKTVCSYLENERIEILGIRFFGSPYNIGHGAFAFPQGHKKLEKFWDSAPTDIDILVTHGPSTGPRAISGAGKDGGDEFVRLFAQRAKTSGLVAHVSGHIHEAYGVSTAEDICFINAALAYKAAPVVLDVRRLGNDTTVAEAT